MADHHTRCCQYLGALIALGLMTPDDDTHPLTQVLADAQLPDEAANELIDVASTLLQGRRQGVIQHRVVLN